MLNFLAHAPPSVSSGSARAAEVDGGPLACVLLPMVLLEPPPPLNAHLAGPGVRSRRHTQRQAAAQAAQAIATRGFCVCAAGLAKHTTHEAASQVACMHAAGEMSAGCFVQQGLVLPTATTEAPPNRTDVTTRLRARRDGAVHGALGVIDAALENFARDVLEAMGSTSGQLGRGPAGGRLAYAGRSDLQLACYPGGGAHYAAHIDNADGDGRDHDLGRVLSLVYYLGDAQELEREWAEADGGALRLVLPPEAAAAEPACVANRACGDARATHVAAVEVPPRAGLLVAFRADATVHEVRPCWRARYAASLWVLAREDRQRGGEI